MDGVDDVVIGAPGTNSFTGAVHIVFGTVPPVDRRVLQNSQGVTMYGSIGSQFGLSVSEAGICF